MNKGSVVQEWLEAASYKQQTVVLCALRGCDGLLKEDPSKQLVRWLRSVVLKTANPKAGPRAFMTAEEIDIERWLNGLDHYPVHWILHLAHACQVISYHHPVNAVKSKARRLYEGIVAAFHMEPEEYLANHMRLKDDL